MPPQCILVQLPLADAREEWRPVVGWESFYEVSSLGRVKRVKAGTRTYPGRILKQCFNNYGYLHVRLSDQPTRACTYTVHRLVTEAFVGPLPPGMVCNHIDGVKTHNTPCNLEIVTPERNSQHSAELGLHSHGDSHYARTNPEKLARGERHWTALYPDLIKRGDESWSATHREKLARGERNRKSNLTEAAVREIRALGGTMSQRKLSERFGVSQVTIGLILRGKTWAHVV